MPSDPRLFFDSSIAETVDTPSHLVDAGRLRHNLAVLQNIRRQAGCRVLASLKAFAFPELARLISGELDGLSISSVNEAVLAEELGARAIHAHAPAWNRKSLSRVAGICTHISLNSLSQWERHRATKGSGGGPSLGLRVNPQRSAATAECYDPCRPGSRLGARAAAVAEADLDGLEGLHVHALCEAGADDLERVVAALDDFEPLLKRCRWVNLGGGHNLTHPDYRRDLLAEVIAGLRRRHDVEVFLEPGAAVVWDCGVMVVEVLDIVRNGVDVAIIDASVVAHCPDVLEIPRRPAVLGARRGAGGPFVYALGGNSCMASDVFGTFSFDRPLRVGERLQLLDMAHYSMVRTSFFNGLAPPGIVIVDGGRPHSARQFGYGDYRRMIG
ncbi:MAG: carboxynorspermidine decarboxylase [Alphaproteobacteria bacterium]|nr:carboxynorspermidine decarboxylase [Alphaproteobacteria bacterium]